MASAITPLGRLIADEDDQICPAWRLELRDFARGLAGGLFVSLPLLFTMEMWDIAKVMPASVLGLAMAATVFINRAFLMFSGFRHRNWVQDSDWWDALCTLGLGALASSITLCVAGIIDGDTAPNLAMRLIALETIPTSMGAAVAMNQLGGGDSDRRSALLRRSTDTTVILGTLLGGFLFAFNVAPTMETKVVATAQSWTLVGATFVLSIAISFLIVNIAAFEARDTHDRKVFTSRWLEALVAYVIAFALSWALLVLFQYVAPSDALETWLPQVVALAYATSLGGAAGRIVL